MCANLLLLNGHIYTLDAAVPGAEAVAIQGPRIRAVGESDDLRALSRTDSWQIVDLEGKTVLPGFTDCHLHLLHCGWSLTRLNLAGILSKEDVLSAVARHTQQASPGEWVQGLGWSDEGWRSGETPKKEDLDRVAPHNPVALARKDGHSHWVNSLALRLTGIDGCTADPSGGMIERDEESGEPTGILKDKALDLFYERVPMPGPETRCRALRAAIGQAQRLGLTSVHDAGLESSESFDDYQELLRRGELGVRVYAMLGEANLDQAVKMCLRSGFGNKYLRLGHVKLFADGSLGSQTAEMLEPLVEQPQNRGIAVTSQSELEELIHRASAAGIGCAVHAIGDGANRRALDAFGRQFQESRKCGVRHRIEHAQLLHPADIPRFKEFDVIASVQPIHATSDMLLADKYWGERARWSYAWKSLLNAGARLAFGSDAPVESFDPLLGIHAAVTRQRPNGEPTGGWYPEQRLSVSEAVHGYTLGAAYSSGEENDKGSVSVGKLADLAVLSQDIFRIPPEEILNTRVVATILDGRIVFGGENL
jgi:predicted amidohydrolase YtcJ